jgi:hypothetical protein
MDIGVYSMATDNIKQVGKNLGHTRQQTRHSTRRFAANLPVVEKSLDRVGTLYTFRMDFYTYTTSPNVYIYIKFLPRFRTMSYVGAGNG